MITAISSFNANSSKVSLAKSKKATSIAFTGIPLKSIEGANNLGSKVSKFGEEATAYLGRTLTKLTGKNELPLVKKPLIAASTLEHFLPDGTPIDIPMPEIQVDETTILDGSNILIPDIDLTSIDMTDVGTAITEHSGTILENLAGSIMDIIS